MDHNTKLPNSLYNRSWTDAIDDSVLSLYPSKDQWRQQFIGMFFQWAEKEDSLDIVQFSSSIKLRRCTLYDWANKYADVKEALDEVKLILAGRRRVGAMTRKYDKDAVYKDMHRYDPEWLEVNRYHADLKKEEDKQPTTFVINMPKPTVVSAEEMKTIVLGENAP